MGVPVPEHVPRPVLEAVRRLLAVPDGPRQRELPSDAILADGAERPSSLPFRLQVVSLQPERLQLGVIRRRELVRFEYAVEFSEVAGMQRRDRLRLEDGLVLVKVLAGGQRPEEARQAVDVAAVLEDLANAGDLLLGEAERRRRRRRR